jgi:hypothetical protein
VLTELLELLEQLVLLALTALPEPPASLEFLVPLELLVSQERQAPLVSRAVMVLQVRLA